MRRAALLAVLFFVVVGGVWTVHHFVGRSKSTIVVQSPVLTTEAWFAAVNARNMPLARAYFAPADRPQMDWSSWGQPFTHLHCSVRRHSRHSAEVTCTFATQNDPASGMSNVNFWNVQLERASPGPWLISTYGQG